MPWLGLHAKGAVALDESRQPLDLTANNSWAQRTATLDTAELLHTLSANAVAPFLLCSRLLPLLAPPEAPGGEHGMEPDAADGAADATASRSANVYGHIVNVSALEGKFAVGKKSTRHPHTNMSKAALNMLTFTCAREYYKRGE